MVNPKTIVVSEDWHQSFEDPMGYAVSGNGEHRLFYTRHEAEDFAMHMEDQEEEEAGSRKIYPLFAADPKDE